MWRPWIVVLAIWLTLVTILGIAGLSAGNAAESQHAQFCNSAGMFATGQQLLDAGC